MSKNIWEMSEDIQSRIREVAYMMWESAGRHQGMAIEYWLQAEREVLTTMQTATEQLIAIQMASMPDATAEKSEASPPARAKSSAAMQKNTETKPVSATSRRSTSDKSAKRGASSKSGTKS